MKYVTVENNRLLWKKGPERVRIEAWGKDSARIRLTAGPEISDLPGALLKPARTKVNITADGDQTILQNGQLGVMLHEDGHLRFINTTDNRLLLEESPVIFPSVPGRSYVPLNGDLYSMHIEFLPHDNEKFYGLGQHPHGFLDQKGCSMELFHHNTEFSIPYLVSSRLYGYLWNCPGRGRVDLGSNISRWSIKAARQMDFWITTGTSYADLQERYAEVTGKAPLLPEWALGFWQSKLRYKSQEELLNIAREYKKRGLPLDVIVIDFFHWTAMGEWKFDPVYWPDPARMVRELKKLGVRVLISVWPAINRWSENYKEMEERNLLIRNDHGMPVQRLMPDNRPGWDEKSWDKNLVPVCMYDPTNPEARQYIWKKVKQNYYRYGIKCWWLDANEPELSHFDFTNTRFQMGTGDEVIGLYPNLHAEAFYEGMRKAGEKEVVLLCRSGWAGIQRYGAILWSGDIQSTFEVLQKQVIAGLNVSMSGIPYWNTDVGGFFRTDKDDEYFRELLIRWFQFAVFTPILRLHGDRSPNEVWSYGEEAYEILKKYLFLREKLRPYLVQQMKSAHLKGRPIMRPLFFDFMADQRCYEVVDQYMFGPDILVAPVLHHGERNRKVYLPADSKWTDAWTGKSYQGGIQITSKAPLDKIPLFLRNDYKLPVKNR